MRSGHFEASSIVYRQELPARILRLGQRSGTEERNRTGGSVATAVGVKLSQGKFNIPCGCNGFLKRARIGWQIVFRNAGLVGLISLAGMPLLGTVMLRLAVFTFSLGLIALPLVWKQSLLGTVNAVAQH